MNLEILGTGGAFSDDTTAYLVQDTLIDCSEGTIKKLIKENRIKDINNLIVTHRHSDHVGGLELLIFYKRFVTNDIDNFTVFAGIDILELYNKMACSVDTNSGKYIKDFKFQELRRNTSNNTIIKNLSFNAIENVHCKGNLLSFSIVLMNLVSNGTVFISGDMDSIHPLISPGTMAKYKYAFHDVGWTGLPDVPNKVHPTEDEVLNYYPCTENIKAIHYSGVTKILKQANTGEIYEF